MIRHSANLVRIDVLHMRPKSLKLTHMSFN
jgi:hypothetical protein